MNKTEDRRPKTEDCKRILIMRLDRIGDVLLSTPVIKAVRENYPGSHITFMVRPYAEDIVKGNPYLNEVIIYDKDGSQKGAFDTLKFAFALRQKKFDMAIVLHPTSRSHIIAFLSGIPERIGYDTKLGWLLTKRFPHTKQFGLKHEVEYALDLVRSIGIDPRDKALYMPVSRESEARVRKILSEMGIRESEDVITLNPGASCPSKRWPPERFAEVADRLARLYGARIVIVAGADDKPCADRVARHMKTLPVNLSGMTSIADLASVLRRSRLFVSNDSGPVHIACALGTPTISIFGRNDRGLSPERWGPTGERAAALRKNVGCDPCLAHECVSSFKCLEAITVDDVLRAAEPLLEGSATGRSAA